MKDSGLSWLGEIPNSWSLEKIKYVLRDRVEKNNPIRTTEILSLTAKQGVIPHSEKEGGGNKPKEDITAYRLAYPGDIVMNSMNILSGSVGLSKYFGCVSPVYYMLRPYDRESDARFFNYIFQTTLFQKSLYGLGNGILIKESGNGKLNTIRMRIPIDKFGGLYIPVASISEQKAIADFLDEKCSEMDALTTDINAQIETLEQYKRSVITQAVTKGLNPNAKMKDSGIDWIGKIPEDWEIVSPYRYCEITRGNSAFKKDDLKPEGDFLAVQYGKTYKVNMINNEYNFYVDKKFLKEDQLVMKGDTIFITTSETLEDLGHSCLYCRNDVGLLGGEQILLRPSIKKYDRQYFYYTSTCFRYELNRYATGLKVYRVRGYDLSRISTTMPPIAQQKAIADYLDNKCTEIELIIADKKQQLEVLADYKKSLIYEYVTGKKGVKTDE